MSVWLHNSLIELILQIRKGDLKIKPALLPWNPVAMVSFFTCLPGRLLNSVQFDAHMGTEQKDVCTTAFVVVVCVCVSMCMCTCY